jgi:site-specific DNA-methyltransferase (cytosine-N4-specific)
MPKSDVVFGSEFSPAVIDLPALLELVRAHQPDRAALQQAIDRKFFQGKGKNADPRKTLGDNTVLAMIAYGILKRIDTATVEFTEFGQELFDQRDSASDLQDLMGRHCLANLDGLKVVSCINDLIHAGIVLKKETIATRLREEGMHVPTNGKHLNILRQWLEFAGVLNKNRASAGADLWTPNAARIEELLGVTERDIEQWSDLTKAQYDFARAFALMECDEATSSDVRDSAIALYGTEFPEGGLPQSVLHKLEDVGLLTWQKTTGGRGAKAHLVRATEKLRSEFFEPIVEQLANTMGQGYKRLSRMSLAQIVSDLESSDKHKKGIALEALAFYFCRRLDLSFVQWRLRGNATGGAEVDMIVEGTRLFFRRWQIQCKNTTRVSTEDLAKEVGVAATMRSNVILLISTGEVGNAVRSFSRKVMENTAVCVILLSGNDLRAIATDPAKLVEILNQQAEDAMTVKRMQLDE